MHNLARHRCESDWPQVPRSSFLSFLKIEHIRYYFFFLLTGPKAVFSYLHICVSLHWLMGMVQFL